MDNDIPETDEQAAARIAADPSDPSPPADPSDPSPPESTLDRVEDAIEHVAQEVEAAVVNVVHTIEHRCFGRPSADDPVHVTMHTGN